MKRGLSILMALSLCLILCLNKIGFCAVAVEDVTGGTGKTVSHDVSGSNTILIVHVGHEWSGASSISSVTYNGDAMTKISGNASSSGFDLSTWYLIAPDDGTHDISITTGLTDTLTVTAITVSGAEQQAPEASELELGSSVTSLSTDITTITDNALLVAGGLASNYATWVSVTNQTLQVQQNAPGGNSFDAVLYTKTTATAGANSTTVDANTSCNIYQSVVSIAPAEAGGTRNRMIMIE